jgi:hypothetical protein
MVNYKYFDIYNGSTEKGIIIYENPEKKISFGLLENNDYLIVKEDRCYKIKKENLLQRGLLPLLQFNVLSLKSTIEEKGLNFFEIVPIEKILFTAFDESFSIYWKELGLNWLEKLNYFPPTIITMLLEKSSNESNLSKDFKFKIQKLIKRMNII